MIKFVDAAPPRPALRVAAPDPARITAARKAVAAVEAKPPKPAKRGKKPKAPK